MHNIFTNLSNACSPQLGKVAPAPNLFCQRPCPIPCSHWLACQHSSKPWVVPRASQSLGQPASAPSSPISWPAHQCPEYSWGALNLSQSESRLLRRAFSLMQSNLGAVAGSIGRGLWRLSLSYYLLPMLINVRTLLSSIRGVTMRLVKGWDWCMEQMTGYGQSTNTKCNPVQVIHLVFMLMSFIYSYCQSVVVIVNCAFKSCA